MLLNKSPPERGALILLPKWFEPDILWEAPKKPPEGCALELVAFDSNGLLDPKVPLPEG